MRNARRRAAGGGLVVALGAFILGRFVLGAGTLALAQGAVVLAVGAALGFGAVVLARAFAGATFGLAFVIRLGVLLIVLLGLRLTAVGAFLVVASVVGTTVVAVAVVTAPVAATAATTVAAATAVTAMVVPAVAQETLKIGGIALFAVAAIWASGFSSGAFSQPVSLTNAEALLASVAFSILAFKGFTTITNSGGEIVDPHRNVGRTIMISIAICVAVYLLVAFGVGASLTIPEIVAARDTSLAAAARPALGELGFYFTIVIALSATMSGVIASVFAVSRMLTMLTEMEMIPHSHFGMSGGIRSHMLVYTVVIAGSLAVLFDLSRIASLGAIFYLVMDMLVHWGVWRHLRHEIDAKSWILLTALAADAVVLIAFASIKLASDPMILVIAAVLIGAVFLAERIYLSRKPEARASNDGGREEPLR